MAEKRELALINLSLSLNEEKALLAFDQILAEKYGDTIRQVSLFGSKARGDDDVDSDIDILVIIDRDDRVIRREIIDIASDLSVEYDLLLSPRVIGEQRWKEHRDFMIYRQIITDAVPISG
jgi:predicted nucleotidyltransferase